MEIKTFVPDVKPTFRFARTTSARFELNSNFYDELLVRLEEVRWRANLLQLQFGPWGKFAQYSSDSVPDLPHLKKIIETAFWASLQKEEGRSLSFSIGCEVPASEDPLTIFFAEPFPFDVDTLVKLAPAVGKGDAGLAVAAQGGLDLKILGILIVNSAPLIVRVLDPGLLIVKFGFENVAVISGDETTLIRDNLLSHSSSIWSKLGTVDARDYNAFADPKVGVLLDILRTMRNHGHGGALLVVPCNDQWRDSLDHMKYPIGPNFSRVKQTLEGITSNDAKGNGAKTSKDWILEKIGKNIARLTDVDGATVLNHDLILVGFGAKIKEAGETFEIIEIDPLERDHCITRTPVEKVGNKRHQSAARFVFRQRDAIALVVSQDGNVTAFVWECSETDPTSGDLFAYRRLELTMF